MLLLLYDESEKLSSIGTQEFVPSSINGRKPQFLYFSKVKLLCYLSTKKILIDGEMARKFDGRCRYSAVPPSFFSVPHHLYPHHTKREPYGTIL